MGVVLDEAEAAGGLVESVEAHDEALDFAALGKELVDLLFCGVKGEVADVESRRVCEGINGGFCRFLCIVISVASAFISAEIVCTRSVEALDGASNFAAHRVTGVQASNWEGGVESTVNQSSAVRMIAEDCVNGRMATAEMVLRRSIDVNKSNAGRRLKASSPSTSTSTSKKKAEPVR